MFFTRTQRDSTYLNGTQRYSTDFHGVCFMGTQRVSSEFMGTQRIFMVFLRISWGLNGSLRSSSEFIGVVTDLWGTSGVAFVGTPKTSPQLPQQRLLGSSLQPLPPTPSLNRVSTPVPSIALHAPTPRSRGARNRPFVPQSPQSETKNTEHRIQKLFVCLFNYLTLFFFFAELAFPTPLRR